ncbi:hypothetical protein NIES2101_10660 [Calothrix sp. HK-06]|nr:hypothetical protein NIES2101_10660 [Calothrix sp. HK-06]
MPKDRLVLLSRILAACVALTYRSTKVLGQNITLDGSLATPITLTGSNYTIPQSVGQTVGNNLFHSFGKFNLDSNEAAIFQSNPNIQNILSRVTGGNQSVIDGLIRTNNGVNLFFINPSGIIFGQNARLDIGGSFTASTANALQFGNLGFFSATDKNVPSSLLTVNPSAFLFNQMNAAPIVNKSVAPAGQTPVGSSLFGLRVKDGQSLRLVGGDVDSSDGDLIALGGQVEISGKNIAVKNIGTIGYFGSPAGAITLKATGNITVSGELDSFAFARLGNAGNGAPISLNTSNGTINITGDLNSWAFTQSGNTGDAGTIVLNAVNGDINITGNLDSSPSTNSGIPGNAGAITFNAPQGSINIKGDLSAYSYNPLYRQVSRAGDGANIKLNAANNIDITGNISSGSTANLGGTGNGGDISLTASNGSVKIQGRLDAASTGSLGSLSSIAVTDAKVGNGGAITVSAGDNIDITGTSTFFSTISSQAALELGSPYNAFLQTGNVGNGGAITLTAPNGIKVVGSIDSSVRNDNDNDPNSVADSKSNAISGSGGAINLYTSNGSIAISDSISSKTSARFGNTGNGGNVTLNAPQGSIQINGYFSINSLSSASFGNSGDGGAINLTALKDIAIRDNVSSNSSAASGNAGNGGDISLNTTNGNISLGGVSSYSLVNYTGDSGNAGRVTLTAPNGSIKTQDIFAFSVSNESPINPNGISKKGGAIALTALNDITTGSLISYGGTESNNINVTTNGAFEAANSIISTSTNGAGKSGDIEIRARSVALSDGTQVSTSTPTQGTGGNIIIIAPKFVRLSGSSPELVRYFYTQQGLFAAPGSGLPPGIKLGGYIPPLAFSRQFGDVQFPTGLYTQTSGQTENAGNAGVINIQTGKLVVQDQAVIAATTFGNGNGGNIFVYSNDVSLNNGSILSGVAPGATGNSGKIDIQSRSLSLKSGGVVQSLTLGNGKAGDIEVKATDAAIISGFNSTSEFVSGLISGTEANDSGQGGNITVTTPSLLVWDRGVLNARTLNASRGGNISVNTNTLSVTGAGQFLSTTSGSGRAGDIIVNATDQFNLSDSGSGLYVTTSGGQGGAITVNTNQFQIAKNAVLDATTTAANSGGSIIVNTNTFSGTGGSQLRTTTSGSGKAGDITLKIKDKLSISDPSTGFFANTASASSGNGGNIFINPDTPLKTLQIQAEARIAVDSRGTGQGGNIEIQANTIKLDTSGALVAETASNQGGNITLTAPDLLLLRHNSLISTTAGLDKEIATGNGGNVTITTPFIVAVPNENSDISANASKGNGGTVNITGQSVFGIQPRPFNTLLSDITASSESGIQGTIVLNIPDIDPSRGLIELPSNLVDASQQIASGCTARRGQTANRFISTGRGGLPLNPSEALRGRAVITNWVKLPGDENQETNPIREQGEMVTKTTLEPIVEAQGWVINSHGDVHLVAQAPASKFNTSLQQATLSCNAAK